MDPKAYLNWIGKTPAPWYPSVKNKVRAQMDAEHKKWLVLDANGNGTLVAFSQPHDHLTIFEAELLYCAFLKRKQRDYARYDKCVAGQRFFADIEKLYVIKDKVVHEKESVEVK